jgi:uracil-DNA glycosylase family 4
MIKFEYNCTDCPIKNQHTKLTPIIKENSDILLVAGYPDEEDIRSGIILYGIKGALLGELFKELGLERINMSLAYAISCTMQGVKEAKKFIKPCKYNIQNIIELAKPKVIVALGEMAFKGVMGKNMAMSSNRGKLIDYPLNTDIKIVPTYSPDYLRNIHGLKTLGKFTNHYANIWLKDWKTVTDYLQGTSENEINLIQFQEMTKEDVKYFSTHKKFIACDTEYIVHEDNSRTLTSISISDGKISKKLISVFRISSIDSD